LNYRIPFDIFQRYMLVKEIIDAIKEDRKATILDAGGYPGVVSDFFSMDQTFIIDLKTCKKENFVRADCQFLPFRSAAFDFVTNIDVLEHLPSAKRLPVIDELLRVTRRFTVIAAPFDSEDVRSADRTLYEYILNVLKREDENLKEHVNYGLPNLGELRVFLDSNKLVHVEFSNGYLSNWLPMQILNFHISKEETYYRVNQLYNLAFYEDDNREPSYRKVILIDKISKDASELSVKTEPIKKREQVAQSPEKLEFLDLFRSTVEGLEDQIQLKDNHIGNLEERIKGLEDQIQLKDNHIGNLEATEKEMEDSLGWRVVKRYRRFNDRYFRAGTRRRVIVDRLAVVLEIILDEGFRSFFHRVVDRYVRRRKQFFELTRDEQYQIWLSNNELTEDKLLEFQTEILQFSYKPKISIVMPVYNPGERWLRAAIDSVRNQVYSNWELCIVDDASTKRGVKKILESYGAKDPRIKVRYLKENRGISGASNEALTTASGDFVGFLDHDDELTRDALFEVVKVLNQNPDLDLIYSDEDKKDLNGRRVEPFFKPDWSPDLLLSMNYICHFTVVRKNLIDKVSGFRLGFEGCQDYDLLLRVSELTDRISHVHKPLYSWRKVPGSAAASVGAKPYARERAKRSLREALNRRGLKGEVVDGFSGHYRVKYAIQGAPFVSIIIPTKDRVDLLKRCLESVESKTSYRNYEIIIVDNNSADESTLAYLGSLPHRVLKFEEPFNFSRINNFGAKYAKGEHLLFLNNDTEVADDHWLDAMLEHSQRPEIGMVGALLLYPGGVASHTSETIQHAGVILGVGGVAGHAFKYLPADRHYYFGVHKVIRNCIAVTGACAMIRRAVFNEVGGFDENLKVAFGDIDLCLRIREKGYRVVYTPYARLHHHECASRGKLHPSEDEAYMVNRWKDTFIEGDPYYNPNLTLLREDYSLASIGSNVRPLAVLLEIYHLRSDLQTIYPEARDGDYRRLIDWAATKGITVDPARVSLRPYGSYYALNTSDRAG